MIKFTKEMKLAAIQAVEGGEGLRSAARRFQMSAAVISHNLGLYRLYGEAGLSSRGRKWLTEEKNKNTGIYARKPPDM